MTIGFSTKSSRAKESMDSEFIEKASIQKNYTQTLLAEPFGQRL